MTVRLSAAIQAHPSRTDLAEQLARQVGADVVYDPDPDGYPSPWRTYRHALICTPADATHRLVIQDDVEACTGFRAAAEAALAARPDAPVAFYVGGNFREHLSRIRSALQRGDPWVTFTNYRWAPAVALAWPAALIAPALAWADERAAADRWPVEFSADDEIIGRALRQLGQPIHATVPSLVQHHDLVASIVRVDHARYAGRDPGRRAAVYIGDHDPAAIAW